MSMDKPDSIFFAKNSGNLWLAENKNSVIVSSSQDVFNEVDTNKLYQRRLIDNN